MIWTHVRVRSYLYFLFYGKTIFWQMLFVKINVLKCINVTCITTQLNKLQKGYEKQIKPLQSMR